MIPVSEMEKLRRKIKYAPGHMAIKEDSCPGLNPQSRLSTIFLSSYFSTKSEKFPTIKSCAHYIPKPFGTWQT